MSRMFLNQVSTRELFTYGSREKRSSQISDNNSQNMYLNSQKEFSENSQDGFSQPFSGEVRGQESQVRRVFDRFMTKRTSSDVCSKSTPAKPGGIQNGGYNASMSLPGKQTLKPNFQQQVLLNKSKAKERDDREMFGTLVSAVKEYSDEVKGTIKTVQDNMEQLADTSNEKFSAVANSIFDGLNENFERIVKAVKGREEKRANICELEKEIFIRDTKIEFLESKIAGQQTERDEQMLENLKKVIQDYHMETQEKIEKMHESVTSGNSFQHQLVDSQTRLHDKMEKQLRENQKTQNFRHEEIKNGLINELQQLRQDLENHRNQIEDFYSTQLSTTHYKNMKEIQYHISSGLDKQTEQSRDYSRDLCNFQINKIKEFCQNQQESHEKNLRAKIDEQAILRTTENEHILREIEQLALRKISSPKDSQCNDTNYYTEKRSNEIETTDVQKQLDSMFERYNKELSKMKSQIEAVGNNKDVGCEKLASHSDSAMNDKGAASEWKDDLHKSVYTNNRHKTDETIYQVAKQTTKGWSGRKKEILLKGENGTNFTFVSPECRRDAWNSKPVFKRPNPSPVVAVLPQPQKTMHVENIPENVNHGRKRKRRKKAYNQPSRKSQRLNKMQSDDDFNAASQDRENSFSQCSGIKETYNGMITKSIGEKQIRTSVQSMAYDSQESQPFKLPQSIPRSTTRPFSSEQKFTDSIPCNSSLSTFINCDKRPLQQNVFPVRPSTYGTNIIRCPSDVHALQPKNKPVENRRPSSMNTKDRFSQNSELKARSQSVYDFRDSPERSALGATHSLKRRQEIPASSQSTIDESSRESSPSLSITKVIIQRKVRSNRRPNSMTPLFSKTENQRNAEIISDDFLNTPSMENKRDLSEKWEKQSVSSTYRRSGEKRKLFNFDAGHELLAIKKAFKLPV